jgi:hypothetical protein
VTSFESSVQNVPHDASVSEALGDIKSAADSLESSARSALTAPDCSSSWRGTAGPPVL